MSTWGDFHGPNLGYILELYERYQQNPSAVDAATRAYFQHWKPPGNGVDRLAPPSTTQLDQLSGVVNLAQAIREYGHLAAQLDPLGSPPPGDPSLDPATYGLTEENLRQLPASLVGGPVAAEASNALEAIEALRRIYSHTIGYDYDHLRLPEEREWLRQVAEAGTFCPPKDPIDSLALLERLTQVEVFEQFLQRTFPGKTRFSVEGLDMLIPILDEIIGDAAENGIYTILVGMAHRGRLNVLAHNLNKPYAQILAEFKDPVQGHQFMISGDLGWTGDVKYHLGARRAVRDGQEVDLVVTIAPNPSHLEAVNPVVEGMARAVGTRVDRPGAPHFNHRTVLPILIHGDAAFPGQGIVAETLNLSRLPGYRTGGTIHIIANNQLGFTTFPEESRSTLYASDLAKGFKMPVVHVNADDTEACMEAARLASAYRHKFEKDFLIDLIGYRRYGHNEGDEPGFTQPQMYQKIESHPTVRACYAETLVKRGIIKAEQAEALVKQRMAELQRIMDSLEPAEDLAEVPPKLPPPGAARRVKTKVPLKRLRELNDALLQFPDGFQLHPKLKRTIERRRQGFAKTDEASIDWATAEILALASILTDGTAIRMTGQDVERGTFSQRHAVLFDAETGQPFIPLQALPQAQAAFEIHNSPLSEAAALGFEYGYNVQTPNRLVIWEAQYGDFINGGQTIVDEFITSARAKWGQTPSLVLLLPHGYEGQGPDHSTGRLERFLQMAAETNMRIANCTTAAQYFHLLRRQAALLQNDPLPLVIMTPKSLLRHPQVASSPRELAEGGWQPVIGDTLARQQAEQVERLILCSGKITVDLLTDERRQANPAIALVRIEQLYPFPAAELQQALESYPRLQEVVWMQEEPQNMGTWSFVQPRLTRLIDGRWPLYYLGRLPSSSPAEGWSVWHTVNQKLLIEQGYNLADKSVAEDTILWERV
ncbi:MAG: 2-oxoglutarate dehydrogenase E1 component [Chloroflexota bacterium]|nr:MAG: 2-oxoglutarate dehydrogenase E1 component [Chloroflexota bacterium]